MLCIKTDIQDYSWLQYILEEFKRINSAFFTIQIIPLDKNTDSENIIYYTKEPRGKINLINKCKTFNNQIDWKSEELFILKNTGIENKDFAIQYDVFWNAFVFLSRLEEYEQEKNQGKIQSYSFKHPRKDKSSFDVPIVNVLFNEIEKLIHTEFPALKFGEKKKPDIDLSHDVDYLKKTIQLRIKQSVFNSYNTLKSIPNPRKLFSNAGKTIRFLFSTPSYWCFNYWKDIEKSYNQTSVFYIYSYYRRKNFKSWLIDPSYDIRRDEKLIKMLQQLKQEGFEIGLHGSYYSATEKGVLKKEKEVLEDALNFEITKTRQHWLNFEEQITPFLHNELFEYDSTLGWNDRTGFRAGCASIYRPYNHLEQKPFDYYEIPQVIMDSNLFDYRLESVNPVDSIDAVFKKLDKCKNVRISVSWHQRVCSDDYRWHHLYEKMLNEYI